MLLISYWNSTRSAKSPDFAEHKKDTVGLQKKMKNSKGEGIIKIDNSKSGNRRFDEVKL